jgi:type I restriction enzyme M protein
VLKRGWERPDNILFIDASQGFEKVGNQNYLRPEHIERIVETYREREVIGKFSKVAGRSEVEENDYNPNIPRYVDTFEEEDVVDLDEGAERLVVLAAPLPKILGDKFLGTNSWGQILKILGDRLII